jgi:hypothetical protein
MDINSPCRAFENFIVAEFPDLFLHPSITEGIEMM